MFTIVRAVLVLLTFIIYNIFLRKSKAVNKRKYYRASIVILILFFIISAFIPFENTFITFSTPISAYNYSNFAEVELLLNGNDSSFIIGERAGAYYPSIIPKNESGWKIGSPFHTKIVKKVFVEGISLCIYRYKNTSDYYIEVLKINGEALEISDSRNTNFLKLNKYHKEIKETTYVYYAFLNGIESDYSLNIGGQTIAL